MCIFAYLFIIVISLLWKKILELLKIDFEPHTINKGTKLNVC